MSSRNLGHDINSERNDNVREAARGTVPWPAPGRGLARRACTLGLALALAVAPLAACSSASAADATAGADAATEAGVSGSGASESAATSSQAVSLVDAEELFSDRDLDGSYDESSATRVTLSDAGSSADGSGVNVDGGTVTITSGGTYVISGSLASGELVVDANGEKVQLVLDGASVTRADSAALYVKSAKKVWVTLAEGSQNALSTTGDFVQADDNNVDGAVFSKEDLTFNGTGALEVACASGHGIVCKDALRLVSGEISVVAARHAIQANDYVAVSGGTWALSAGTDGIHAENSDDAELGFIYIAGGALDIQADSDGMDANYVLEVDGGSVSVAAGDDGLHAEYGLVVNGGDVTVSQSYEGLEGSTVTITGGIIDVTASDDGINAAGVPTGESDSSSEGAAAQPVDGGQPGENGGQPGAAAPGGDGAQPGENGAQPGGGMDDYDSTAQVIITGGSVSVLAGGDGIDSNGDLTVTGGATYVSGPTSDGDGSLDFPGTGTVTVGVVMCAGSSGMAQNFSAAEGQGSLLVDASGSAGDEVSLTDANGTVLASFTARASYACVLVTAPGVEDGGTYTLSYGTNQTQITMDGSVYTSVTGDMGQGQGGMGGPGQDGSGAGRPDATGFSPDQQQAPQKMG